MALPLRRLDLSQEVQTPMQPPLCPLCYRAMQRSDDGVWQCPVIKAHEFYEEDGAAMPTAPRPVRNTKFGLPCPRCGTDMKPVPGTAGAWRCVQYPAHEFLAPTPLQPSPPSEPEQAMPQDNPLLQRSAGFWLSHIGLQGPISWAPQSNITDGTRCLLLPGSVQPGGGGSKSGGRRKKNDGGKKFVDSPWGSEGGTNAK